MIQWNSPLDWFEIDPKAPVKERRVFSMEKAKLEALRHIAEGVDDLTQAVLYGVARGEAFSRSFTVQVSDDPSVPEFAHLEAVREIANAVDGLVKATAKRGEQERDVSGTGPSPGGSKVLLDKQTGNLLFEGVKEHETPLYQPGRHPGLPYPPGTIAHEIAEGLTKALSAYLPQMVKGPQVELGGPAEPEQITPGDVEKAFAGEPDASEKPPHLLGGDLDDGIVHVPLEEVAASIESEGAGEDDGSKRQDIDLQDADHSHLCRVCEARYGCDAPQCKDEDDKPFGLCVKDTSWRPGDDEGMATHETSDLSDDTDGDS